MLARDENLWWWQHKDAYPTCVQTAGDFVFLCTDRFNHLSRLGLIDSFDSTFCKSLPWQQLLLPLTISKMRERCLVRVTDGQRRWREGQDEGEQGRVLLPVNLGTGVFLWLAGDAKEEVTVLLAKSLHYGLFSHLAQFSPSSIWTPLRQSVYYSSPIWCSWQKNMIALPCLCLPCIVTNRSAAGHYGIQPTLCDTTLEGVMSPGRRFHQ